MLKTRLFNIFILTNVNIFVSLLRKMNTYETKLIVVDPGPVSYTHLDVYKRQVL